MSIEKLTVRGAINAVTGFAVLFTLTLLAPATASAHCDGKNGPVVTAAKKAIATRNVVDWI